MEIEEQKTTEEPLYNNSHKSKPIRVSECLSLKGAMKNVERHPVDVIQLSLQSILLPMLLIIVLSLSFSVFAASPDEKDKKRVLVVNSYHIGYAWTGEVMNGFRDVLNKHSDLEVFIEYLDAKRNFGKAYFENMKQIYRDKYKNRGIDVIIISDDEAFNLVLEIRAECFPNVPIAVCGLNQDLKIISNINFAYAVKGGHDGIKSTIDLILSLQPDIETVFFVSDDSKTGKSKLETVRQLQPAYKEKVGFKYLSGMRMDELQTALRRLPKKSAVFNLIFIRDSSGKVFSIKDSSQMIGNSAGVPVYRSWGFQPDTSIMGGHINTGFVHGKKTAQIAMKLLNNEEKLKIPSIQKVDLLYMFDYRAMKRFNIGIKDIPENSVVYNKPFSIYENYRWHILGIIIFMIAQTLLVISLVINQKKRKKADEALQAYQHRLKALASQLTITEEKERRRIAADLHDFIGHSLALARIQLVAVPAASSKAETTLLVKDVSNILLKAIQDTKHLIFELSSPLMNEIGLAAAVSELLEEQIGKRYRLETEFIDKIDDSHRKVLDENVRAILFRSVRELLINVVKHAQANKVRVFMEQADALLKIVVQDDGVGFNPEEVSQGVKQEGKFGLFSIQERIADLGGALEIVSEPGKGCKVIMSVPIEKGVE